MHKYYSTDSNQKWSLYSCRNKQDLEQAEEQSLHIVRKVLQHQKDLFYAFINLKKTFDMVPHNALWTTMRQYNMGIQLIGIMK